MAQNWQHFALDEIERSTRRLSIWERPFVDSIRSIIKQGLTLSRNQDKRLMQIYQRMTDAKRLPR